VIFPLSTSASLRIVSALLLAALYGLLSYFLIESAFWDVGLVSITFAILQPAAICAFVAFIGDPLCQRPRSYYTIVPPALTVGMIAFGAFALDEGVVCIVMLAPLWLLSGWAGSLALYMFRSKADAKKDDAVTFRASAILALPLVLIPVEQSLPLPEDRYTVSRDIIIEAERNKVWRLMQTVSKIGDGEGHWNVTQDWIGVPRPLNASLEGSGNGAIRHAKWGAGIHFEEHVRAWEEGRLIQWDFVFPPSKAWDFTDPHLHPDSRYMRIESGGYSLEPVSAGTWRLTLKTRYAARTRINPYGALWGELFLGDIQENILAVIKQRAEAT